MYVNAASLTARPLVSVVIPCRNNAVYLPRALESILAQDYPSIECIVIDGASTDGTLELLKGYGNRIRWVSEPDRSAADAINKGWRMAQGGILAWLNADDLWEVPSAVSTAVRAFDDHPEAEIVYGDCTAIDAEGRRIGPCSYMRGWNLEHAIEHCEHGIPQPAAFIRREAIERVGALDPGLIFMDRDLWYRIGLRGKIQYIPQALACARTTPSYWLSRGREAAADCVAIMRRIVDSPDLPASLRAKRRRIVSNAYLRGIDYAFGSGRYWNTILAFAWRAVREDRSNARRVVQRLRPYVRQEAKRGPAWRMVDIALAPVWFWARP
jgi:glycosyltransferase involved in cell wall biosynthesis